MKVKELIEQLSYFNPELEVLGKCTDPTNYVYKVPIEQIILDDPYDSNGYSGIDGSEDFMSRYEDDDNYIKPKAVIIDLGDV